MSACEINRLKQKSLGLSGVNVIDTDSHNHSILENKIKRSFEDREIISSSTQFGTKHIFKINPSEMYVSDFVLQVDVVDGTTTSSDFQGAQFIKKVEVKLDGFCAYEYTGEALQLLLKHLNYAPIERWQELYELGGGNSAVLGGNKTYYCDIYAPGQKCVYGSENEMFPVHLLKNDMIIEVEFNTLANSFNVPGTATLGAVKLNYRKWESNHPMETSYVYPMIEIEDFTNGAGTDTAGQTFVANVSQTFNVEPLFLDREVTDLLIMLTTSVNDGLNERLRGEEIVALDLQVNGKSHYEFANTLEGRRRHYTQYHHTNRFPLTSNATYYAIPMSHRGRGLNDNRHVYEHGLNLNNERVRLSLTVGTGGNFMFNFVALNQAKLVVGNGKVRIDYN